MAARRPMLLAALNRLYLRRGIDPYDEKDGVGEGRG